MSKIKSLLIDVEDRLGVPIDEITVEDIRSMEAMEASYDK